MRVLKRIKGSANPAPRLRCLERCWTFFIHQANFPAALEAANQHYLLVTKIGEQRAAKASLNVLGVACAELGNIPEALIHYSRAFELSRALKDIEWQAVVLNNLGTALNYSGLYREAIPCLRKVLLLKEKHWKYPLEKRALTNLAQSHYYLSELDEAFSAICQAVTRNEQPDSAKEHFEQAIREFTFVEIALELDRFQIAQDHSLLCQQHALLANSLPARLIANVAAARCAVRAGNVQVGLSALEQAVLRAKVIESVHRDALIATVKAYDEAGRPEAALCHIERLLEHVRERRIRSAKALLSHPAYQWVNAGNLLREADLTAFEQRRVWLRARVAERDSAKSKKEMLERLAITADLKEEASGEHGYRVGRLAGLLAARLGWTREAVHDLELAARLHDIGKICIPDRILGTSGALQAAERNVMCLHTVIGAELLAKSEVPQLRIAEEIARYHHEWWDGTGYPTKRAGKSIPIHARIVSIADVFDSLTHGRSFAPPWPPSDALSEIQARRGTQFQPELTDAFLGLFHSLPVEKEDIDTFLLGEGFDSPFRKARQRIRALLHEHLDV
jgi:putative two-component system response regulator